MLLNTQRHQTAFINDYEEQQLNGLEFTSTLIGQLISWPVAILVVALTLRKPITELLPKLKSYEGMGQKLSFGDQLAGAEESADRAIGSIENQADPQRPEPPTEQSHADPDEFATLGRAAEANPSYLILVGWEELASATNDLAGASLGTDGFLRRNPIQQVRELQQRAVINKDFAQAVTELRQLRNRVAHGQHNPTSGEALAYVETAKELTKAARVLANLVTSKRDHRST